jgi:uncharacterized protein involved in exopolysaccharide biosynthesis
MKREEWMHWTMPAATLAAGLVVAAAVWLRPEAEVYVPADGIEASDVAALREDLAAIRADAAKMREETGRSRCELNRLNQQIQTPERRLFMGSNGC